MMVRMAVDATWWQQLFDAIPVPISAVDLHGRQLAANAAYAEFLGYGPDELDQIDIGRITREQDVQWTGSYLTRLASGELGEFESDKIYVRKDGTEVTGHLSARALFDDDRMPVALVAVIEPLAARPDQSRHRPVQLIDYTSDTVTIVDRDGNVIEAKGRASAVMGYPREFWEQRNIRDLVQPDDVPRLVELRDRVLAEPRGEVETEIEVVAADGSPQILNLRLINLLDDPDVGGLVLVTRNVTEFRRTVQELGRRRETAESLVDAQTRLLATVSHELRNPLHAARGLAELLASEELPPATAELAGSLVRQLASLSRVTEDLLDAARLDAGQVHLDPVPTDVRALLDDVISLGRGMTGDRPVTLSLRVAQGVPDWIRVDPDRLRQVLGNLVGNAVKFTPQGSVELVARAPDPTTLDLSVIDTGVGIPPAEQTSILEPFSVGSTAGEQRGAGLGLSIVKRLVHALDGMLTVTSTPGAGSRFDVRLPLARAEAPAAAAERRVPAGLTALVVEDNPVNQQLASSQLERLGIRAVIAGSGEEGLELLSAEGERFDVVLMDEQLPGLRGTETTRRLRTFDGPVATVPVIGLSASATPDQRAASIDAGMDDFIAKPASLDDLSVAIGHAVRDGRQAAPPAAVESLVADGETVEEDTLERLADELGGSAIVCDLVTMFLDELPGRLEAIESGLATSDDLGRRAAHTLKASAGLLGARQLADACASIEQGVDSDVDVAGAAALARTSLETWLLDHRGRDDDRTSGGTG